MNRNLPRPGGQNAFVRLRKSTYQRIARICERMEKLRVNKPLVLQDVGGNPVISLNFRDELYIVNVEWDGTGSQGTTTAPASWKYNLYRLGIKVASGVNQEKPRPNGTATVQAGSSGFGLGFDGSDGKVHLWDAGEVYGSGTCP